MGHPYESGVVGTPWKFLLTRLQSPDKTPCWYLIISFCVTVLKILVILKLCKWTKKAPIMYFSYKRFNFCHFQTLIFFFFNNHRRILDWSRKIYNSILRVCTYFFDYLCNFILYKRFDEDFRGCQWHSYSNLGAKAQNIMGLRWVVEIRNLLSIIWSSL